MARKQPSSSKKACGCPVHTVSELKEMYNTKLQYDTLKQNSRLAIAELTLEQRAEEFEAERKHFEVLKQAQKTLDEASPHPAAIPAAIAAVSATPAATLLAAAAPALDTLEAARPIPTPLAILQYELLSAVAARQTRQK